jgi:hypothetical protein
MGHRMRAEDARAIAEAHLQQEPGEHIFVGARRDSGLGFRPVWVVEYKSRSGEALTFSVVVDEIKREVLTGFR